MFWRFGVRPAEGGEPPFLFDELRHRLRYGDGPWVRLPHNPALILSLLLRMHASGRTVTSREVCAFLELPAGTRTSGHVSELRKKIAQCGGDAKLIEGTTGDGGYRLAADIDAASVAEADQLQAIERMLAHPEITPGIREQLAQLRASMLLVPAAFAVGITLLTWALVRPSGEAPIARLDSQYRSRPPRDPEPGPLPPDEAPRPRTLVPQPGVRVFVSPPEDGNLQKTADGYEATLRRDPNTEAPSEACFQLPKELHLRERDVLAVDLALLAPLTATRIAMSIEQVPPKGIASLSFDVAPGHVSILRIPATQLAPDMRAGARTICLGEDPASPPPPEGEIAIGVYAVRVE